MRPLCFCLLLFAQTACAQPGAQANRLGRCNNPAFDREVASLLKFTVPAIDVDSLRRMPPGSVLLLDAREPAEYAVSHIEGARNCGYDHFDASVLEGVDKSQPVVVYCSIGYRSEKMAEKIRKAGFTNVSNLYGSIFEWANRDYPLVDEYGRRSARLHTYNRDWGRWVSNTDREKLTRYVAPPPPPDPDPSVRCVGAMRNVMRQGELFATVQLDTLPDWRHLYGLGPLEYLRGEILVLDGRAYRSSVAPDGSIEVTETRQLKAPFFVYANVSNWKEQALPDSVTDLATLEHFLQQQAPAARPFAFLLKGDAASAGIHVQNLPEGAAVHAPEDARRSQKKYTLENETVEVLGFFSTEHQGVFTHHDTFLHLHLRTQDGQKMGHLETLHWAPGAIRLLK